jgi:hypothetical protein
MRQIHFLKWGQKWLKMLNMVPCWIEKSFLFSHQLSSAKSLFAQQEASGGSGENGKEEHVEGEGKKEEGKVEIKEEEEEKEGKGKVEGSAELEGEGEEKQEYRHLLDRLGPK